MNYEKKYKEALSRAKNVLNGKAIDREPGTSISGYIFPELKKESEDEKVKRILHSISSKMSFHLPDIFTEEEFQCFDTWSNAWLEKQGGQKEINLVEILKHYPRETELYSPLYGKLWLAEVDEEDEIITCYTHHLDEGCTRGLLEQENLVCFYSNGTTGLPDFTISKDCMLFLYNTEKQSGQKSVDKVEPKFKVGDWIVNSNGKVNQVTYVNSYGDGYTLDDKTYMSGSWCNSYHLWTIQDAKDGDVLHCWIDGDEFVLIYKGIKDGYITTYGHLYQKLKLFAEEPTTMFCRTIQGHFTPATKEQRDLLFQKMHEAGYEWDAEKKGLNKIHNALEECEIENMNYR